MLRTLSFCLLLAAPASAAPAVPTTTAAEVLAERMLGALGGRANWAALRNTINDSQQNRAVEPTVVRAVISMEFDRPRFRIETTGPNGLHTIRVIDGARSWRLTRDGKLEAVPADLLAEDMQWYAGHVYRTLHRVAARDPRLTLGIGEGGRLEVFDSGARIAWYRLDARGEPYAFGAHDDDRGSLSGPWEFERGGVRHPLWVSSADGSWRANVKGLETNARFDDALFARPTAPPAAR